MIDNADANFEASQRYSLDDLQPALWALQYTTFKESKRVAQRLHADKKTSNFVSCRSLGACEYPKPWQSRRRWPYKDGERHKVNRFPSLPAETLCLVFSLVFLNGYLPKLSLPTPYSFPTCSFSSCILKHLPGIALRHTFRTA